MYTHGQAGKGGSDAYFRLFLERLFSVELIKKKGEERTINVLFVSVHFGA